MVNTLSWILPFAIVIGSLVDAILVYIYMKYVHQWKDILSSEEVSNPELESQMEESNEQNIETSTEQSNESLVELSFQNLDRLPNDPPIESPQSDPTIETTVTTVEQNIESPTSTPKEAEIQAIDDIPGM